MWQYQLQNSRILLSLCVAIDTLVASVELHRRRTTTRPYNRRPRTRSISVALRVIDCVHNYAGAPTQLDRYMPVPRCTRCPRSVSRFAGQIAGCTERKMIKMLKMSKKLVRNKQEAFLYSCFSKEQGATFSWSAEEPALGNFLCALGFLSA